MGTALERVLAQTGYAAGPDGPLPLDPGEQLVLNAQYALGEAARHLLLASDGDADDKPGKSTDDHSGHGTYKKLVAKGMSKALAAKMCAKADANSAAATAVASAILALSQLDVPELEEISLSVTQAERDKAHAAGNSLDDKSYPINNVKQLHSAAILAASKHGNYKAAQSLIRRRAKDLGVDVNTLPGFGSDSDGDSQKAAATAYAMSTLQLAQGAVDRPGSYARGKGKGLQHLHPSEAMDHGNYHGLHAHAHVARVVVHTEHFHNNDSVHGAMIHPQ